MASAKDIEEQAAKWLIELDAGGTATGWEGLTRWLAENPKHRAAYLRLSRAWNQSDALRRLRPLDYLVIDVDVLANASRELSRETSQPSWLERIGWHRIGLAVAGTLAVVVCGAIAWQVSPRFTAPVHQTGFADTERIALPDGSKVQLNGDSAVRIVFTPTSRNIVLERGEALFEVAPDVRRPFRVTTDTMRATAAESRFAVRHMAPGAVDVLVAEGQVVFERARSPLSFGTTGARFTRTLWSGDRASANDLGVVVRRIGTPAVYRMIAWRNGQVAFLGETLGYAVREINRYNRRPLRIEDPEVANLRVSGTFDATDTRGFLSSLEKPLNVKAVSVEDRAIRLVSAQR